MDPWRFVRGVAGELEQALGPDLVGVYLHGSLALGCFNPVRSDVDLLLVVRQRLRPKARRRVAELVLAQSSRPYPLELTALSVDDLRPWRHPTPFDFHFGESHRGELEQRLRRGELVAGASTDPDLAGHIGLLQARGRVLLGPPIDAVFPPVPEADFRDSILRDLEWIRRPGTRMGGTIYGILNACRVLAYLRGEGILSKAEAGEWALPVVPAELRETLERALAAYRRGDEEPCGEDEARRFVAAVSERVAELTARSESLPP